MSRSGYEIVLNEFIGSCVEFRNYKYLKLLNDIPSGAKAQINGFIAKHIHLLEQKRVTTEGQNMALQKSFSEDALSILRDVLHTKAKPHLL